jgi:diacylglycerol O-acyltransferase
VAGADRAHRGALPRTEKKLLGSITEGGQFESALSEGGRDLRPLRPRTGGASIEVVSATGSTGVERLSPSDVMELACDVTGTSMQVAAILMLDTPGLHVAVAQEALEHRVTAIPRLRQRLLKVPFCGRPVWVDDLSFDIRNHVDTVDCAASGDQQQLMNLAAELVTRPLRPDRPLWSATLITGLAGNRNALVVVFHHVLADGIGGLAVLGRLVDGAPIEPDTDFPRRPPRPRDLFVDLLCSARRTLARLPVGLARLQAAATELGAGSKPHAPRCTLNRPIGTGRQLGIARANLGAVHAVAHAAGGTINDVVLTAVTGALRSVLANRGETVTELVISMPVSARRRASTSTLGNQVGVIPVTVPATGEPTSRLAAVARITRQRKTAAPGSSAALLGPVFRALAKAGIFGWFINRQRLINTFVSNLRGPADRLSFCCAPVVEVIPVPLITGNISVAFAALSYARSLTVTAIADPEVCPDLPDIICALQQELDDLTDAVMSIQLLPA